MSAEEYKCTSITNWLEMSHDVVRTALFSGCCYENRDISITDYSVWSKHAGCDVSMNVHRTYVHMYIYIMYTVGFHLLLVALPTTSKKSIT